MPRSGYTTQQGSTQQSSSLSSTTNIFDAKPNISVSDATTALSKCTESLSDLYRIQSADPSFINLRSECFCDAMLYGTEVNPHSVSLLRSIKDITATLQEAKYLASLPLLNTLPSAFRDIEVAAKKLVLRYTAIVDRLSALETRLNNAASYRTAQSPPAAGRSLFSMLRTAVSGQSQPNRATAQDFRSLQRTLRDLTRAIKDMQEFVQWVWKLALSVKDLQGTGQLERLAHSWTAAGRRSGAGQQGLSYLEVLGSGVTTMQEYETLRNVCKDFMECLYSIPDRVSDDAKDKWFEEIKDRMFRGLPNV